LVRDKNGRTELPIEEGACMSISVLVVDDSSTIRKIIQRCIQQAGLGVTEICEAGNGQEALDLLAQRPVDLVLTDINMPRMDGLQLLSAIRQSPERGSVPVLMITTEAGAEAVVDAISKGATG
jgi:two-component system, chemotaxis family, chemotaxis protein CheY